MDLTPVQKAILIDLHLHGHDKAENIQNRTGFHRNSISRMMGGLQEEGYIQNKGGGVYRLTDNGREAALGLIKADSFPYQSE